MYTLCDIPYYGAKNFPDREAVVFEDTRMTYSQLNRRVNRLANALVCLGLKKGDHLAVLADNCSKYLEIYFAAAKIGVCVCPQNHRLADPELEYVVNHGESIAFMVGDGFEDRVLAMKDVFEHVCHWISLDHPLEGFLDYDTIVKQASDREPDPDQFNVQEDDLAVLMYTGGTTGLPKGVMLSHRNFMTAAIASSLGMAPDLSLLPAGTFFSTCYVLPIFHVSIWPILVVMLLGGKVVINRIMDLGVILKLIQDEKCSHLNLVPTIYGWLADYPDTDKYDLSSLISLTYAGSPFPPEVLKKCIRKFGNIFSQGYGATETAGGPVSMFSFRDHVLEGPESKRLASAGKPAPCSRVCIMDEDNQPVPAGEPGEICAKGEHIMKGYWKDPDATAEALKEGWYHTGDMGYMDEDGFIYMTDRKADMIISGGENVYPKETEDIIYQHPAVQTCAVVPAPDPKWGEKVQAVVVLQPGQTVTEKEIIDFCKGKLAGYKCPKSVVFWETLPMTIVGKIIKKEIKAAFWEGKDIKTESI